MADTIQGPVTNVVDGDTFDINVTHVGSSNQIKYNNSERIRIASIDAPELGTPAGTRSKQSLERRILNKVVHCTVQARDTFHRIVAHVRIMG